MNLLIFGVLNHQHIQNFARALKNELGYTIYGINNNCNIRSKYEYITSEIFDEYKSVKRIRGPLDSIVKIISAIWCFGKMSSKQIDIVQFHFVSLFIFPILLLARVKKIKTSVFVYGSDVLRSSKMYHKYCYVIFKLADSIVCDSTTLYNTLKGKFSNLNDKLECVLFGSIIVDKLSALDHNRDYYKIKNDIPTDHLCVMCGYNAVKEQNHLKIINSLDGFQDQLFLILPMTYGGGDIYISLVKNELEKHHWSYVVLESFIEDELWCEYTAATDVFIHMQETDAFSSSLAEHLFMGNIVINAEWLRYDDLVQKEVSYLCATFDNLHHQLEQVVTKSSEYKELAMQNKESIRNLKSLSYTINSYWSEYFLRLHLKRNI